MPDQGPVRVRRKSTAKPKDDEPSPPKKLNLGSPIGPHGHTSVQDKIKKWQNQGGGAIIANDGVAVASDSDAQPSTEDDTDVDKRRKGDATDSPGHKRVNADVRKAITPKKRVISDGHWVKKMPKPPPPPPEKQEKVMVRPSTKRKANGEEKADGPEEMVVHAPGSPIKKSPTRKETPKKAATPARKPTGIEAWINDVEETPAPHSRTQSRHSKSADEGDSSDVPRARSSRRRKPRVSDMSWAEGDEGLLSQTKSSGTPKTPTKSSLDTRTAEERAVELVAIRRESNAGEKWRTRSASPAAPPLSFKKPSPAAKESPLRETRSTSPDLLPLPDKRPPKRSTRRERQVSEPIIEEPEKPATSNDDRIEQLDAELRRLKRSLRERKVEPKSAPATPKADENEANDVELRRLNRSLKERKFSYTPTIPPDEPVETPQSILSEPTEKQKRKPSSGTRDDRPKSSHSSASRKQASQVHSDPTPAAPPPVVPRVFGSRIDAWLSNTPDPFVDDGQSSAASKTETGSDVASSYLSSSYFSSTVTDSVTPSEAISNVANRIERERRRARLRALDTPPRVSKPVEEERRSPRTPRTPESIRDIDPEIEVEYASNNSGSTLKRRGARRTSQSPVKERISSPLHDSPPADRSEVSESSTSSAPPPPPLHGTASLRSFSDDAGSDAHDAVDPASPSAGIRRGSFPFKRPFPTTGKRLSTIASVETFHTKALNAQSQAEGSEVASTIIEEHHGDNGSPSEVGSATTLKAKSTSLKRRLTTHADLMSVLSLPDTKTSRSKTIMSARSIRTNRSRLATATMEDLMNELASDESKYMRELRTLVNGVIPVLLSCVLSKTDSTVAAGLFHSNANGKEDATVTKPIVEMGVALERLKSVHKRIPLDDPQALLAWAETTQKVYADYAKAWRLGFQDVVVNLARADEGGEDGEELLPQNEDGDVVDANGERVDVAFLLKRPLVRIKYLSKTFKGINILQPSNRAESVADAYQDLVILARKRTNEERARLEDEAAANIDPTRARDPKTLAPLAGVRINPKGFVRARDYFDMHLLHTSGQEVDCRIEILMRDAIPGQSPEDDDGDVLICEVDETGRWLFLPPVQRNSISARKGAQIGELVLMIRGNDSVGIEWHEIFSLKTTDDDAAAEWIQMIGIKPVPPGLSRAKSFVSQARRPPSSHAASSHASSSLLSATTGSTQPLKSRTPSPREIEVPIGERAGTSSKRWSSAATPDRKRRSTSPVSPITPPSDEYHRGSRSRRKSGIGDREHRRRTSDENEGRRSRRMSAERDEYESDSPLKSIKDAFKSLTGGNSPSNLKRTKAKRLSRNMSSSPAERYSSYSPEEHRRSHREGSYPRGEDRRHTASASAPVTPSDKKHEKDYSVWYPPSNEVSSEEEDEVDNAKRDSPKRLQKRPTLDRRASSVPTMDLPTIPKLRKGSDSDGPRTPVKEDRRDRYDEAALKESPISAPPKLQKDPPSRYRTKSRSPEREKPPAPPPHRSSVSLPFRSSPATQFAPTPPGRSHRRTSSPLKHEYQPSTASESSTESDVSDEDDDDMSSESEIDDEDVPLALLAKIPKPAKPPTPPETLYSPPNTGTIGPSQSASQAPYRTVPHTASKSLKAIAAIFCWSDKGHWEPLHPDDCSVVITAGLIEAFEMTAAHSFHKVNADGTSDAPSDPSAKPLIGLELTPIVPLRRGTAVDISIRSPPTKNSILSGIGNNVMFRSRSPEECEALYQLINWARINNPTYIALQNARGPNPENTWAATMDRRNSQRANSTTGGSSWWQFGGTQRTRSYRASSTRAASTNAMSESSIGSTASLFSAMRHFSSGGRLFNVAKSSVTWKNSTGGSTGNSFDSLSGSGSSTPPLGAAASKRNSAMGMSGEPDLPPGTIASFQTRLYIRESNNRWRDLGSARMQIMQPSLPQTPGRPSSGNIDTRSPPPTPQHPPSAPASNAPSSSTNSSGNTANSAPAVMAGANAVQKRVLMLGKTRGETLLDVTLGESAFEKVARVGVAVNVITPLEGGTVAARGGVAGVGVKTYMIQVSSSAHNMMRSGSSMLTAETVQRRCGTVVRVLSTRKAALLAADLRAPRSLVVCLSLVFCFLYMGLARLCILQYSETRIPLFPLYLTESGHLGFLATACMYHIRTRPLFLYLSHGYISRSAF